MNGSPEATTPSVYGALPVRTSSSPSDQAEGPAAARGSLLPFDGEAWLVGEALCSADAERLFRRLHQDVAWRQDEATIMGRRLPIPRLQAWYGDGSYVYSGIRLVARPWTEPLLELKVRAERLAGHMFNSVLANLYRHGSDSVAWHADAEAALGRNPVIASLSLGACRRFDLRHRRSAERLSIDLPAGSCLIMAGATQHCWQHRIAKTSRPLGPRINLTFRLIRS